MEVPDRMVTGIYDARHPAHDTIAGGVDAKYYQLAYNVTGESGPKPITKVVSTKVLSRSKLLRGSGGGAWQVVVRQSTYDASDVKINDGHLHIGVLDFKVVTSKNSTYGLNWILNPSIKFMFNYADTDYEFPVERLNGDDKIQVIEQLLSKLYVRLKMKF